MNDTAVVTDLTTTNNLDIIPVASEIDKLSIVSFTIVFVLGTTGNGLVIFFTGFRMKKTVNIVWILSLAIADFIFSFSMVFNIVYIGLKFNWPFGEVMCKLKDFIASFNLFASIYLLVVISIDRCISVRCPVWAQNHRTPQLASFVVLGVCIVALVLSSPDLYYSEIMYNEVSKVTTCTDICGMIHEGKRTIYNVMITVWFISGFIIPFSVIVVCYGAIWVKLRRGRLSQSSRPFKVITAVTIGFFVCWFPCHVFSFLTMKQRDSNDPWLSDVLDIGAPLSLSLAYFNSCLNPILYFCMGHNFKEKLRCSLLSALANVFTEDDNHSNTNTTATAEQESLEPNPNQFSRSGVVVPMG